MKYLGKKSLSSFLSGLLHVSWYIVLAASIITVIIGAMILFSTPVEDPAASGIAGVNFYIFSKLKMDEDWQMIKNTLALKIIIFPYFGVVAVLLLQIIKNLSIYLLISKMIYYSTKAMCLLSRRSASCLLDFQL